MKKIILFGAGFYGDAAYYKLKKNCHILFYVDNDKNKSNSKLHGIQIINLQKLEEIYDKASMDVIVSSRYFSEIGKQLCGIGISEYYIMVEGLLYHKDLEHGILPCSTEELLPYKKTDSEKSILFVQNTACIRTNKIANAVKKHGWHIFLAYSMIPPESFLNGDYADIYDNVYKIDSIDQLVKFVNRSEFDYVHSSNEPDLLSMVLHKTNKTVIHDCHDLSSAYKGMTSEEMAVEFMANKYSDGVIYTTEGIRQEALKKFKIPEERTFVLKNLISSELSPEKKYEKISVSDNELHCVYEGGVASHDKESHRYFEKIWKRLAECGIHIHFYTNCEKTCCDYLESVHEKIHYEGNLSSKQLAVEMSKYDIGLCILNVTEKNRRYLEYASPNKIQEYVNAGIPVAVGNIESQIRFVEENGFGKGVDLSGDIQQQMFEIAQIKIEKNILFKKGLTLESKIPQLMEFYKMCGIKNMQNIKKGKLCENNTVFPMRKEKDEKNVLFVQSRADGKIDEMVLAMKALGNKVYLLYMHALQESSCRDSTGIFDGEFTFHTANGIIDFIENSDFDIVYSDKSSLILDNILLLTSKRVVLDAVGKPYECKTVEDLFLKYMVETQNDKRICSAECI